MDYLSQHEQVGLLNPFYEEMVEIDKGITELISLLWDIGLMTTNSCQECQLGIMGIRFPVYDAESFINIICAERFDHTGRFDSIYDGLSNWDSKRPKWQLDASIDDSSEYINEDDEIDFRGSPNFSFEITIRFPIKEYKKILSRVKKWKDLYGSVEEYDKLKEKESVNAPKV